MVIMSEEHRVEEIRETVVDWMMDNLMDQEQLLFWAKQHLMNMTKNRYPEVSNLKNFLEGHGKCIKREDELTFRVVENITRDKWGVNPYQTPETAKKNTRAGQFCLVLSPTGADVYYHNSLGTMVYAYKASDRTLVYGVLEAAHIELKKDLLNTEADRTNASYWSGFLGWVGATA